MLRKRASRLGACQQEEALVTAEFDEHVAKNIQNKSSDYNAFEFMMS